MEWNAAMVRYAVFVQNASPAHITQETNDLLHLIDGDVFYRLSIWPAWVTGSCVVQLSFLP